MKKKQEWVPAMPSGVPPLQSGGGRHELPDSIAPRPGYLRFMDPELGKYITRSLDELA